MQITNIFDHCADHHMSKPYVVICCMRVKYRSSFWKRECGTSWIMSQDASVENKVFRTNFIHLVYTSWWQLQGF